MVDEVSITYNRVLGAVLLLVGGFFAVVHLHKRFPRIPLPSLPPMPQIWPTNFPGVLPTPQHNEAQIRPKNSKNGLYFQAAVVFTGMIIQYLEILAAYECHRGFCSGVMAYLLLCSLGVSFVYRENFPINAVSFVTYAFVVGGSFIWDVRIMEEKRYPHRSLSNIGFSDTVNFNVCYFVLLCACVYELKKIMITGEYFVCLLGLYLVFLGLWGRV